MNQIQLILLSLLLVSLTGCSNTVKSASQDIHATTSKEQKSHSKNKFLSKDVIISSENSCIDDMTLLKQTSYNDYQIFFQQYSGIMNEYQFLRINSEIMDSDTKRYLTDILTIKYDTLCSKIKFSVFQSIKKK